MRSKTDSLAYTKKQKRGEDFFGLPAPTDRATNRCPQHGSSGEILSLTNKPTSACSSRARVSLAAQLKLFYKTVHTAEPQLLYTFREY